jgi:hypothetical protein
MDMTSKGSASGERATFSWRSSEIAKQIAREDFGTVLRKFGEHGLKAGTHAFLAIADAPHRDSRLRPASSVISAT